MPKYKLDKRQVSRQDTTSPKNIVKGGGTSTTPSKGWVGGLRSTLPINAAMFIQDLAGNKTPLTTSDMKDSELKVLRQAARNSRYRTQSQSKDSSYRELNDSDYPSTTAKENMSNYLRSPVRRMQTTIGGGTLKDRGANTRLTDTFDYNTNRGMTPIKDLTAYDALRTIGGKFGSKEGDGVPVDINLGNLKRPTKYEEETMKFKKGTKGIRKAVNGLQDVVVPEQGSYSNVLSSTSSLAAAGSQFGPWGAAIGGAAGLGLGLLQKSKQDAANRNAVVTNQDRKMNRAYVGEEDSINQAPQRFKKGTKMIEIEGKKTPEIHTDKNFNVKNLGTTPHSKGGDKVQASEGDVVFNTQNSLTKFNKIATAIQLRDKATLNKEKNKLPEDKGSKNQTGNRGVSNTREKVFPRNTKIVGREDHLLNGLNFIGRNTVGRLYDGIINENNRVKNESLKLKGSNTKIPSNNSPQKLVTPLPKSIKTFNAGYKLPGKMFPTTSSNKAPVGTKSSGKVVRKTTPISNIVSKNNTDSIELLNSRTVNDISTDNLNNINKDILKSNADAINNTKPLDVSSPKTEVDNKKGQGLNNALQFAGVANNLFQGLKGEKPVNETYVNPQTIKYNDRSQSLRNQSNQAMNAQIANARSLSGGNIGNLRANSTAARIDNLTRQGGIDEREQARADAIQAQNVGIKNQATEVNANRKDKYQELNMQNRAAKQSYIDQAASDIGQYGMSKQEESYMRNRDRLAGEAQMAGYKSINGRYHHKSNLDGSTYFEPDAESSITRFGTSGGNRKTTPVDINPYDNVVNGKVVGKKRLGLMSKGTKAVSTKYKLKSVV